MKESSYDKVFINVANKNILQKSELEYTDNLYLTNSRNEKDFLKVSVSEDLTRKLNLLTLRYRPKCAFSGNIVGFRWFTNDKYCLSETAYHNKNFP